jgi:hypothetical protein
MEANTNFAVMLAVWMILKTGRSMSGGFKCTSREAHRELMAPLSAASNPAELRPAIGCTELVPKN